MRKQRGARRRCGGVFDAGARVRGGVLPGVIMGSTVRSLGSRRTLRRLSDGGGMAIRWR